MSASVGALTPQDLADRLARGFPLAVLDVREPMERAYSAIRVPGPAIDLHVPMQQVPEQVEAIQAAAAGRELVIYCHHGVRSERVAQWLAPRIPGTVNNLVGGIDAWSLVVDPGVPRYA